MSNRNWQMPEKQHPRLSSDVHTGTHTCAFPHHRHHDSQSLEMMLCLLIHPCWSQSSSLDLEFPCHLRWTRKWPDEWSGEQSGLLVGEGCVMIFVTWSPSCSHPNPPVPALASLVSGNLKALCIITYVPDCFLARVSGPSLSPRELFQCLRSCL